MAWEIGRNKQGYELGFCEYLILVFLISDCQSIK